MNFEYRKGCLIKAAQSGELDIIAHQANCFHKMKSGIAPQIAAAFPIAYDIDCSTSKGDEAKLGTFSVGVDGPVAIYNLYGQFGWKAAHGNYGTVEKALNNSLKLMAGDIEKYYTEQLNIGFPKIGAGLGGGNWKKIEKFIISAYEDTPHNVYIYTLD